RVRIPPSPPDTFKARHRRAFLFGARSMDGPFVRHWAGSARLRLLLGDSSRIERFESKFAKSVGEALIYDRCVAIKRRNRLGRACCALTALAGTWLAGAAAHAAQPLAPAVKLFVPFM